MYQYPYGNAQQLNLDWILSKLQELESGHGGGADLEEVANALVSASFDATIPYRKYDYAFYDGKLYRALNDTIGAFNPADWMEVTLGADIPVLTRLVNADSALITTLQNQLQNLGSDEVANESTVTGTTVSDALGNLNGAIGNINKWENTTAINFDTETRPFVYFNMSSSTGTKPGFTQNGYLFTYLRGDGTKLQFATPSLDNEKIWIRKRVADAWGSWRLLTQFGVAQALYDTSSGLNTLNSPDKNGLYYLSSNVPDAPTNYTMMLNLFYTASFGAQVIFTGPSIYTRLYSGSPASWSSWYRFAGTIVS